MIPFAQLILGARQRANLTQTEAAARLRISRRALQMWEAAIRIPTYPTIVGSLAILRRKSKLPSPTKPKLSATWRKILNTKT